MACRHGQAYPGLVRVVPLSLDFSKPKATVGLRLIDILVPFWAMDCLSTEWVSQHLAGKSVSLEAVEIDHQQMTAGGGILEEVAGRLQRLEEADVCRAVESLVVGAELAAKGFRHQAQAGLSFQPKTVALRRRQGTEVIDFVEGHRHGVDAILKVELNAIFAIEGQLTRQGIAGEGVHGWHHVRVELGTITVMNQEAGFDRARSGDRIDRPVGSASETSWRGRNAGARIEGTAIGQTVERAAGEATGHRSTVLVV